MQRRRSGDVRNARGDVASTLLSSGDGNARPPDSVSLRIERCNDLGLGDEIKALFLRNERPTFPAFFDRAYPLAYGAGGASWVVREGLGGVVGHLAVFPRRFRDSAREARAGLLMDALFDPAHRNFWNAVTLVRRVVADLRDAGSYDFAYTDPTPPAQPVLKAVGFTQVDSLQRFVAPLYWLYLGLARLRTRPQRLEVERLRGLDGVLVSEALRAVSAGTRFRAERSPELYATRLGLGSIREWEWLLFRSPRNRAGRPVAGLVLTAPSCSSRAATIVDLLWDECRVGAEAVLAGAATAARAAGCRRLSVVAPAQSALASTLTRSGFVNRGDPLPLFLLRIRQNTALPLRRDWVLTYFDGSAW